MGEFLREVIFPFGPESTNSSDWILLALRLLFGTLLFVHGVQKLTSYKSLSKSFLDPIGFGGKTSLRLAIFAEFFCSLGVITGCLFRLALIPIITTMGIAAFFALKKAPWIQRELPVSYLLVFILLIITGPGRFSIDYLISLYL